MITVEQVSDSPQQSTRQDALQVVHSTPGRLRVRLAWLKCYPSLHQRLSTSISSLAAVTEVRLNPAIGSIVVCYDPRTIPEKAFQEKFCQIIQQVTPASWLAAEKQITGGATSPTEVSFSEEVVTGKIQEVGGKLIGSTVGRVMGFGVGAVAGGVLLGPLGLIPGAGVGSAVGRTVGSQIGGETVRYLSRTEAEAQRSLGEEKNPAAALQATLEGSATELIGETVGGMAGLVVGGSLLGPLGSLLGGVVGGVIGGQVGEEWWSLQQPDLKKTTA